VTRPTPRGRTASTCAAEVSRRSFPNRQTRSVTATPRLRRRSTRRLRRRRLPRPQRRGTGLQPLQELARHRHPLRQARRQLPRRGRHRRHHLVAARIGRHALVRPLPAATVAGSDPSGDERMGSGRPGPDDASVLQLLTGPRGRRGGRCGRTRSTPLGYHPYSLLFFLSNRRLGLWDVPASVSGITWR
jgi:hypothetical protein